MGDGQLLNMAESQLVENLNTMQAAVHSFLRPLGFRKKGRPHNRRTKGGELTHVVNFQMGECPNRRLRYPGIWRKLPR